MLVTKRRRIIDLATKEVMTTAPTTTVKAICDFMIKTGKRKIPIVDSLVHLKGIVTSTDLINYFGGGDKYFIMEKDYKDNFLSGVNAPISKIMTTEVLFVNEDEPVPSVADVMLNQYFGGLPVLDKDVKLVGIVTEQDFISPLAGEKLNFPARYAMSKKVITVSPDTPIKDVARIMCGNQLRRLPVVSEHQIVGMVRAYDILKFISDADFAKFHTSKAEFILDELSRNVMSKDIYTIDEELDLGEVIHLFKKKRVGGFPIIKGTKLMGIITERDVFRAIYSTLRMQFPKKFNEIVFTLFHEK
jgi:CBS domain-containing protein